MKGVLRFLASVAVSCSIAANAQAAYDVSGKWEVVWAADGTHYTSYGDIELLQISGTLSSPAGYTGTIDEGTGVFHLDLGSATDGSSCGPNVVDGSVSADGKSFTATRDYYLIHMFPVGCRHYTNAIAGTRCGNGQIDAWEDCDLGDAQPDDCCSSSCTLDAPGTCCGDDGEPCTDDVCDGAGTCEHPANSSPCVEAHGCATGTCSGGSCVLSSPEPAGTSCDLDDNVCTPDACDGTGTCGAAAPVDCAPCGHCDPVEGCVNFGAPCEEPYGVQLSFGVSSDPRRNRFKLKQETTWNPDTIDPTVDATFAFCLYENSGDGIERPVFEAIVPPGGTCDGVSCWKRAGSLSPAYSYKDRGGSAGGVSSMRLMDGSFKAKGGGENLDFGLSLPTTSALKWAVHAYGPGYDACYGSSVMIRSQTAGSLKAEHRP